MSGGGVPYHLRVNKAVDRNVFIEVLTRLHGKHPLLNYRYVTFGGPFLEDLRLVHDRFGLTDLVSIESDENTFARQRFNCPLATIDLRLQDSSDFISQYDSEKSSIVWLDYAAAHDQGVQLGEVQQLLSLMRQGDVLKVTLNANPTAVKVPKAQASADASSTSERLELRRKVIEQRFGDFCDKVAVDDVDSNKSFSRLLYTALRQAAYRGVSSRPGIRFHIVTALRYSDGPHQMVTVTGIVGDEAEVKEIVEAGRFAGWDLYAPNVGEVPALINVPQLSVRERLVVDSQLPGADAARLAEALGFACSEDSDESADLLKSYIRYYRHLPFFSRIIP